MKLQVVVFSLILWIGVMFLPATYAEPTVSIIMEKTTYSYCERLFYIIEVSEVRKDERGNSIPAIIHIRDESGIGSSAIPIAIGPGLQTPVPALFSFDKEQFALGKYFIDVEYLGAEFTAEFELVESENICIPESVKQFIIEWLLNEDPDVDLDGYLIQMIQKYVDPKLIEIPFEVNGKNIRDIDIPNWVKNVAYWWVQGMISDKDFAQMTNYLIDEKIISSHVGIENGI